MGRWIVASVLVILFPGCHGGPEPVAVPRPGVVPMLPAVLRFALHAGDLEGEATIAVLDGQRVLRSRFADLEVVERQREGDPPGFARRSSIEWRRGDVVQSCVLERDGEHRRLLGGTAGAREQLSTAPATLVVGPHLLGLFDLAERVPRLPGALRGHELWIADRGTVEAVTVEYRGVETVRAGAEEHTLHAFTLLSPSLEALVHLDARGAPARLESPLAGLTCVGDPALWLDAGEDAAKRRDRDRPAQRSLTLRGIAAPTTAVVLSLPTSPAPHAVAVLIGGGRELDENGEGVDGAAPRGRVLESLSDAFVAAGVATLRLTAAGGPATLLRERVDEWRDVLRALSTRADLDLDRLCLLGHSEGGLVALELAAGIAASEQRDVALVLIGTPSETLDRVLPEQMRRVLAVQGAGPAVIDRAAQRVERYFDWLAAGAPPGQEPEARATLERWKSRESWLEQCALHIEAATHRGYGPSLLLWGEWDLAVAPRHAARFARWLEGRGPVSERIVPDCDHFLLPSRTGDPVRSEEADRRLVPRAGDEIRAFVRELWLR